MTAERSKLIRNLHDAKVLLGVRSTALKGALVRLQQFRRPECQKTEAQTMRNPENNKSVIMNVRVTQLQFTDHRILEAYGENMKPTIAKREKEF